ncbi:MAG: integron [Deltaproteobacteria bacterium]|nr:integron [Deltaproteobacteria bacterium]
MRQVIVIVFLLSCSLAFAAQDVPVMIGSADPELDACLSLAEVSGLEHSHLSVRTGPGLQFNIVDSLANGQQVWVCDSAANGLWLGIVYSQLGTETDCGVPSPVKVPQKYAGPCRFGWVHSKWIRIIAG